MALKDFGFRPDAYDSPRPKLFGPRGAPVDESDELRRVLELPRRPPVSLDSLTAQVILRRETAKYRREHTESCRCSQIDPSSACITELLPIQAVAMREIAMAQGLVGSIVVGAGKSILNLLALLALDGCRIGLLLVPANLMRQICVQYELLSQHFRVPNIVVHRPEGDWASLLSDTAPLLHVMSHNGISSPRQSDYIERISPDAIIIDEVDAFSDLTSARTIRLNRYFIEHGERTKFCGWTGSLTDQRIEEMAHPIVYALKERAPVPIDTHIVEDWGRCLNAVDVPAPPGALLALVGPQDEGDNETELVRAAFRRRLEETQGIVMTSSADVETVDGGALVGLEVTVREAPEVPEIIRTALQMVRNGVRPDTLVGNAHDEVFADPMVQVRCAREVACGMFYRWIFPRGEPKDVIDRWFEGRKAWNSELRTKILQGARYLDSPNLCELAARRHHGDLPVDPTRPTWASKAWPVWSKVKDTVQPQTQACRLHPYLVEDAARWAATNRGIVWYSLVELSTWLAELTGLPVYGGGPNAEEKIEALLRSPCRSSAIVSINSHGRGRDGLQKRYDTQLILNVPSSSKRCQQLLARLHRRGQRSNVVRSYIYTHTEELQAAYLQALRRSDYVEAVLGQRQKLKMARDEAR
jgi:hypothetical protein